MKKPNKAPAASLHIPSFFNENNVPDPRRLVSVADAPIDQPPLAQIILLRHGGSNNPVLKRGSLHTRFRMPSMKTGMSEVGEGKGEELLAMACEVNPMVSNFKCHPYQFILPTFSYKPDAAVAHRSGEIEVVEVKRTPKDIDDTLRLKLPAIKEVCRLCGMRFSIRFLADIIGSKHRVHNIERLFGRRAMELSVSEQMLADATRVNGQPITWGEFALRLSPGNLRHGDAIVEHLIAAGHFTTDLDAVFTSDTMLTPLSEKAQLLIPGFEERN